MGLFAMVSLLICSHLYASQNLLAQGASGGRALYYIRVLAHVPGVLRIPVSVAALSQYPLSFLGYSHRSVPVAGDQLGGAPVFYCHALQYDKFFIPAAPAHPSFVLAGPYCLVDLDAGKRSC